MLDTPLLKVAIIGKAPSSRDLAPYDDDSFEIWTLSNLAKADEVPRFTRHFELHPLSWFDGREEYLAWLSAVDAKTIYLRQMEPTIPAGVPFPKDEIVQQFGTYFTNTVSWMIALAIHEQASHIHVYGVDMAQDLEYIEQRPSCEFFLGWARALGIDVYIPPESDLLKARKLYGFDHEGDFYAKWKARTKELRQRHQAKMAQMEQAMEEAAFLEGALDSQNYFKQWI